MISFLLCKVILAQVFIQVIQLRLSRSKGKRSNTSANSLLAVAIKNTQTERNMVSWIPIVAIYIHKKARFNFILGGKPMNGNIFGNKTSHSRQALRAYI